MPDRISADRGMPDEFREPFQMEIPACDPQAIADDLGLRKEQVQYMWATINDDPTSIAKTMALFKADSPIAVPFDTPDATIRLVWATLGGECQNSVIGETTEGCMFDGTCVCDPGWAGPGCQTECLGGADNPCSGNGICRFDGKCECDRGWTGPECSVECSGAAEHPLHFPCNLNGFCNGWFRDARTQFEYGPVGYEEARYVSRGQGLTFFEIGTELAVNGTCTCHYGFRSDWGQTNCGVRCQGVPQTYLDETGECFDNGLCNATGMCECYEGYRNVSCNVECLGGHLRELSKYICVPAGYVECMEGHL